jgi:hypothetical protein
MVRCSSNISNTIKKNLSLNENLKKGELRQLQAELRKHHLSLN